jgi:hypothetical protein
MFNMRTLDTAVKADAIGEAQDEYRRNHNDPAFIPRPGSRRLKTAAL